MVGLSNVFTAAVLALSYLSSSALAAGGQAPEAKCTEHHAARHLIGKAYALTPNKPDQNWVNSKKWEISRNYPTRDAAHNYYPYMGNWFTVQVDNSQVYTLKMKSDTAKQASRKFIVDVTRSVAGRKQLIRSFYIANDNLCSFVGTGQNEAGGRIDVSVVEYQ